MAKRRPRRAPGEFVRGDVVVVKPWRFTLEGIRSSMDRRIGRFLSVEKGLVLVYCPSGGFVSARAVNVVRATAAQERAFRGKWDRFLAEIRRGR